MTVDPLPNSLHHERTRRRVRAGWIAIGLLALAAFFMPHPDPEPPWDGLVNFAHVPVFAVFGFLIARWLPAAPTLVRFSVALGIIFVCGVAIEMLQPYFGRGASFDDLGADLGAGLAGFAAAGAISASSAWRRAVAAFIALLALTAGTSAALGISPSELYEKLTS